MCSLCRQFPCHPRCPNAPEPVPLMRCKECGEGIYEGDYFFDKIWREKGHPASHRMNPTKKKRFGGRK